MASRRARSADTLLVAATGGHLDELFRMRPHLVPSHDVVHWVTFDEPQSRAYLATEHVTYVHRIEPRAVAAALTAGPSALALVRRLRPRRVISTGSAIAVPFLAAARACGVESHYIESAARSLAPSLTGKLVSAIPGVRLHTQYAAGANSRWHYSGSVFDGYEAVKLTRTVVSPERVVVTLGTMREFGFRRAVVAIQKTLHQVAPGAEVLWQVGPTDTSGLEIEAHDLLPATELAQAIASADLIIAHAGVGSALAALDAGQVPLLLPRRSEFQEHVDDHQRLIAGELASRNLAIVAGPTDLTADHCWEAMRWSVTQRLGAWSFEISETRR